MNRASQCPNGLRFLENLAYLVPGYEGYKERGRRREEDSRLRARVYRRLLQLLDGLQELQTSWQGAAAAEFLEELVDRRQQLLMLSDAVRFSPGEACRFFLAEPAREQTLERILEADLLLFGDLDDLAAQIDRGRQGSTAPRTLRAFLRGLDEPLRRLEQHLLMRERALAGG